MIRFRNIIRLIIIAVMIGLPNMVPAAPAPAKLQPMPNDSEKAAKELFDRGYRYFSKEQYKKAAPLFLDFMSARTRDDDEYEWAEFFLGICFKKTGMSHAAVDTLSWLVTRKPNPRIVSYTLELFEEITRTQPYDHESIIKRTICDQEYGFIDKSLSNFINFHQGVFDWKNGFSEWGEEHFKKINKKSIYFQKYRFHVAINHVAAGETDAAVDILETILEAGFQDEPFRNRVRKTLARLLYEHKEYKKADELYEAITTDIVYQSQNLLERAWAQYRLGNQEKAMGLLYAFNAPAYRNAFSPEYFLLKSFIYKDVCNYRRALSVIDQFREHYRNSLQNIYIRGEVIENREMLMSLLGNEKIKRVWDFLNLLEEEKKQIAAFNNPNLVARLENIYTLQLRESTDELQKLIRDYFERVANDLLEYEEKTDLMAYEISLDMYQRVYQYHYDESEAESGSKDSDRFTDHYYAFFPFQNEFWNDELDHYKVVLEDKCSSMEEWDIFFK